MHWDLLIRGARVFDGTGGPGRLRDVAIKDGRIAAFGEAAVSFSKAAASFSKAAASFSKAAAGASGGLPASAAARVEDAFGAWMLPGLIDIHTHEDLEVELAPGLPEVVRHGTTSVIVGNCSIGMAFGAQRTPDQDPIVDCFARVENIPKSVLRKAAEQANWTTPAEYLDHLDSLPLAANMAPLLPHSMLRIDVMGLADSISRDPSPAELQTMVEKLERAMTDGYIGFSTDGLPLHFLASPAHLTKRIPTQYASYDEYRALTDVVRRHGRVWQMTPATDDPALTFKLFMLTSGRGRERPLKITALAALDSAINRMQLSQALNFSRLLNSKLVNGHFRMQALAAPFKVFSEGVVSPLAEADPLMRRLIQTELDDVETRRAILSDPEFIAEFREMWGRGKTGFNLAHMRRRLRLENAFMTRDLNDHVIYRCPVQSWVGMTMAAIYVRYRAWRTRDVTQETSRDLAGGIAADQQADADTEATAFVALGSDIEEEADFFLALLRHFDRDIHWHYVSANRDPKVIKRLLLNPLLLPGFNDSGAHVTNMAYYDGNLRALRIALEDSEATFSTMVRRLTREPAEFFGLDAGRIDIGSRADITLIRPEALRGYDGDAGIAYIYRDVFDCHQLVNRSDGVVEAVYIAGTKVWNGTAFTPEFGRQKLGRALRAKG